MRCVASVIYAAAALQYAAAVYVAAVACTVAAQCEGSDGSVMAEAESEQMQAELMQTRAHIFKIQSRDLGAPQPSEGRSKITAIFLRTEESTVLSAEQRASLIVPIAWFHVPKTGSSFENTFYHTPAICPGFPADAYVSDLNRWNASWGERTEVCRGGFSSSYGVPGLAEGGRLQYDHSGIGGLLGQTYNLNRGHFVTMLRNPEQRLISMYNHFGPVELFNGDFKMWPFDTASPSLQEYADVNAGCAVRQLTYQYAIDPCWSIFKRDVMDSKVSEAIEMLQDGFVFVGITEQWALSVCLFRMMFGGQCRASDLVNTRPGTESNSSSTSSDYDTSELYGWVDPWDGPLYAEALSIFDSTRKVYNAEPEWCSSFCEGEVNEHGQAFDAGLFR